MSKEHHKKPPPPTPREQRRQNMARFGSTMYPGEQGIGAGELEKALAVCASAGLPDPVITAEDAAAPGEDPRPVDVYTFVHFRVPPLSCRVTADQLAAFPDRVIQICKNAGIRADSLPATDDPPIEDAA